MKTVVLVLMTLLCLNGVWALKCHSCSAVADTCSMPVECPPNLQACQLIKATAGGQNNRSTIVTKKCVQSCDQRAEPLGQQRSDSLDYYIDCCTTDLCNAAPGWGLGIDTMGMMLLTLVLAAFLGSDPVITDP